MIRSRKKQNSSVLRDSSSLQNLDREYITNYRAWRRRNRFGFYMDDPDNELTYREGDARIDQIPDVRERVVINRITGIIMLSMILYTIINYSMNLLAPVFNPNLDLRFGSDYFRELVRGNEWTVFLLTFVTGMVSRLIPLVIIIKVIKMPLNVMAPVKVRNKHILYMAAIPAALLNTCICFIFNQFYLHFLAGMGVNIHIVHDLPESRVVLALTLIMETVIFPMIGEIMISGAAMQLLRQFGDGYAIFVTTLMTTMSCFDVRMIFCIMINSVIIGYFTLRTGSAMTAVIMRVIVRITSVALIFLSDHSMSEYATLNTVIFLFVSILISVVLLFWFQIKYNDKMTLDLKDTFLTGYEKLMYFFTCPYTLIWLAMCISITLASVPLAL